MALQFYDETQTLFSGSPLRAVVNGHIGGSAEKKFYIKNGDNTKYYTDITVGLVIDSLDAAGELGASGISVKFLYGEQRPTEAEWDVVLSGDDLALADIGTTSAADISTYHPVWIRIYVPGNTPANIFDSKTIRLTAFPRSVGA